MFRKEPPVLLQSENAECGLVCMAMVSSYLGHELGPSDIRKKVSISNHGVSLGDMVKIGRLLGLEVKVLKTDIYGINRANLPYIAHWSSNHYVVIKRITGKYVYINDPAIGARRLTKQEAAQKFSGLALRCSRGEHFKELRRARQTRLSTFLPYFRAIRNNLAFAIFVGFALQLLYIASALYMQFIVDHAILNDDFNMVWRLTLVFILMILLQAVCEFSRGRIILLGSNKLQQVFGAVLFENLLKLPVEYFTKRNVGDVLTRFASFGFVRETITQGIISSAIDGVLMLVTLATLFYYSVPITLVLLAFLAILAILRFANFRQVELLNQEVIVSRGAMDSFIYESVKAVRIIKLLSGELDRLNIWRSRLGENLRNQYRLAVNTRFFDSVKAVSFGSENLVSVALAAYFIIGGTMTLGVLLSYMAIKARFMMAFNNVFESFLNFKLINFHLDRLGDIYESDKDPYYLDLDAATGIARRSGHGFELMEVRDLGYRYGEFDNHVFRHLNFCIRKGESAAIAGPSGAGKSTLLLCLMGLLQPTEGEILIDGRPLANVADYRRSIAGVLQDDTLFAGSILENISFFDPAPKMEQVRECARLARIDAEIERFPGGYNTLVGDMGSGLSGGQRQRIILARALYRAPTILFMDEATSHLDVENENEIAKNLARKSITRIFVSHRKSAVDTADKVIDMRPAERVVNLAHG